MTTTTTTTFRIHAIPDEVLRETRDSGVDISGNPIEHITAEGGEPVRCCLRDARPGDELILFRIRAADPGRPVSRNRRRVRARPPLRRAAAVDGYPPDWYGRSQILRAYDHRGRIHDATTQHDGQSPEAVIAELLADPGVAQIHSRNIAWGCYMFRVTRAD